VRKIQVKNISLEIEDIKTNETERIIRPVKYIYCAVLDIDNEGIRKVKIGCARNAVDRIAGYKTITNIIEQNIWYGNPYLPIITCENGLFEIAELLDIRNKKTDSPKEVYFFTLDNYEKFKKIIGNCYLLAESHITNKNTVTITRKHKSRLDTIIRTLKNMPNSMANYSQWFAIQTVCSSETTFQKYKLTALATKRVKEVDKSKIKDPVERKRLGADKPATKIYKTI